MPAIVVLTDTQLAITRSNALPPLVGFDSKFVDEVHPNTGKKIVGWKWDERIWPTPIEFLSQDSVPSIWDPDNSALNPEDFQSGIGDGLDLKVRDVEIVHLNDRDPWTPIVEHGYYYDQEDEGYLYSDGAVQERFEDEVTISGSNYRDLTFTPKPGIPISAAKWQWNEEEGRYDYAMRFRKKASFTGIRDDDGARRLTRSGVSNQIIFETISDEFHELVIESDMDPQRAFLNGNYIEEHGLPVASGLSHLENLGVSTGTDEEEFNLLYSPVASGINVDTEIVSFATSSGTFTTWTQVNEITASGQYTMDFDLGIIRFGTGAGFHPADGETVAAHYKSTVMLEYEPIYTTNRISSTEVNLNPLGKTSGGGFIFMKREVQDPFNITLSADTDLLAADLYGPIFLGSATRLFATVTSRTGQPLEGLEVTFNLVNEVGGFTGGDSSVTSLTNFNGVARTSFNSPRNIRTLGAIGEVVDSGITSTVTVSGTSLVGDPEQWYIYKVFDDDPVMGISDLDQYYIDYFAEEGITGPTSELEGDTTGDGWEQTHRLLLGLLTPTQFNILIRNGKKQLVVVWDDEAINPHTYAEGAFVPLRPTAADYVGSNTVVTVEATLDVPRSAGNESLAGYFIVGPTIAQVQATVYNERLGITIESNVIELEIRVPPSMDGTVLIENLNAIQRDALLGLPDGLTSGTLPLGFRLRSNGFNLAAVLDGLTYLSINRPTEILGHAFTVI